MAHFARINNSNIVDQVIVAEQDFVNTLDGEWIQTSYNTRGGIHFDAETGEPDNGVPLRKNYAGIGFTYNRELDAFIPPQPDPTYVLNTQTCLWEPPVVNIDIVPEQTNVIDTSVAEEEPQSTEEDSIQTYLE